MMGETSLLLCGGINTSTVCLTMGSGVPKPSELSGGRKPKKKLLKMATITITKRDEGYDVNYQFLLNGKTKEIEGFLSPYHTGRCVEYDFQPYASLDSENEEYYSDNWESIEEEILNQLNNQKS